MAIQKLKQTLRSVIGEELRASMSAALNHIEDHFDTGSFQLVGEFLTLLKADQRILCAMQDKQRRGILAHPSHRTCFAREFRLFLDQAAQELNQAGIGAAALNQWIGARRLPVWEVRRTEQIDAALDRAGLIEVFADIEFTAVARRR